MTTLTVPAPTTEQSQRAYEFIVSVWQYILIRDFDSLELLDEVRAAVAMVKGIHVIGDEESRALLDRHSHVYRLEMAAASCVQCRKEARYGWAR
jgi:hypothetical protein